MKLHLDGDRSLIASKHHLQVCLCIGNQVGSLSHCQGNSVGADDIMISSDMGVADDGWLGDGMEADEGGA